MLQSHPPTPPSTRLSDHSTLYHQMICYPCVKADRFHPDSRPEQSTDTRRAVKRTKEHGRQVSVLYDERLHSSAVCSSALGQSNNRQLGVGPQSRRRESILRYDTVRHTRRTCALLLWELVGYFVLSMDLSRTRANFGLQVLFFRMTDLLQMHILHRTLSMKSLLVFQKLAEDSAHCMWMCEMDYQDLSVVGLLAFEHTERNNNCGSLISQTLRHTQDSCPTFVYCQSALVDMPTVWNQVQDRTQNQPCIYSKGGKLSRGLY